jgi:hypothetical protein
MSPEQAAGRPIASASDWYSVGVMLYECLVGRRPFEGNPLQVVLDKQQIDPPRPSQFCERVPEDLEALCVDLLRRRPEDRPAAVEILRRLGVGAAGHSFTSPETTSKSQAPFVGRRKQLHDLSEVLAKARQGRTAVAFLQGKSGEGKSALARRFLDHAGTYPDVVILSGRCFEQETVPYKALDSIIDALSRYLNTLESSQAEALLPRDVTALTRVFPVLRRVDAVANVPQRAADISDQQELRQRAFAALTELLGRLGDRKTLILYIDDLQWGDLDSAKLLGELLRPPNPPVLLLLACYRSEDRNSKLILRTLLDGQFIDSTAVDVREITVGPLTFEEARELALRLLEIAQSPATAVAEAIARESAGNPYLVDALVRHQLTTGVTHDSTVAINLDEVLWTRVRSLTPSAQRLIEVIAVAGHPLRQADACWAAGIVDERHEALGVLRTARLIRTEGADLHDRVETYHDQVRESVVSHLPAERLKDCHHRLAAELERSEYDSDPATLAIHYLAADHVDEASRYYALAAERAAKALAFDRAVDLYRLALEFHERSGKETQSLRERLAEALANAGRGLEAAREYNTAAQGAIKAAEKLELLRNAAMQSLISGHIDDGLAALRSVLGHVKMTIASTPNRAMLLQLFQRARLRLRGLGFRERDESQISAEELTINDISWSAARGLSIVDPIRAGNFAARSLLLSLRAGEPNRIARALALYSGHVAVVGGPARSQAARLLSMAASIASRTDNYYAKGLVYVMSGLVAFLQGRFRKCLEDSDTGEAMLRERCSGVAWELNTAQSFALWALFYMGQISEIKRRLPLLLTEARERGNLYALSNFGTFARPLATLADDDPDRADRELREVMDMWTQQGFHVQHQNAVFGVMQIEVYRGNGLGAWEHINQKWPEIRRSMLSHIQVIRIVDIFWRGCCALTAAAQSDRSARFLRAARRDIRCLYRERMDWAVPLAQLLQAGGAALVGKKTDAVKLLSQAAMNLDRLDMGLYAASARRRLGMLLGTEEGERLIQSADDWMASQQIQNPVRMSALYAPGVVPDQR